MSGIDADDYVDLDLHAERPRLHGRRVWWSEVLVSRALCSVMFRQHRDLTKLGLLSKVAGSACV